MKDSSVGNEKSLNFKIISVGRLWRILKETKNDFPLAYAYLQLPSRIGT